MTVMEEEDALGQGAWYATEGHGVNQAEGVREQMWVRFSRGFRGKSEARKGKEASDWLV